MAHQGDVAKDAGVLPTVALGRTRKRVSRYGLGGFHQVEISADVVADVVDAYLGCGGNYIETARNYGGGASEEKIGRALVGRRERVVLSSKTAATTADEARRDLEASLNALRTDRLEFYFFHGVTVEGLNRITSPDGALKGLLKAKEEGVIDGLGMSSHTLPVYLEAFERLPLDLILVWCNYLDNLNYPIIEAQIIPAARERGIGVTAMKPLADGFLHRSVEPAVRYCLGVGVDTAVGGTNSVEQVAAFASAIRKGPADDALRRQILADAVDLGRYVCRRCGRCPDELMNVFRLEGVFDRQMIDFLPRGAEEAALRKVLSHWYSHEEQARQEFATAGGDPERLIAAAAEVDCPYGIDVPRKARIAVAKLTDQRPELV